MSNYKFDQFYYSNDKDVHPLCDISDLSDAKYAMDYADKIYCPLCHIPKLARVNKNGKVFLRAYPKQHHGEIDGEICMYEHDTAPQKAVTTHIENLHDQRRLQQSLETVIRMMLRKPGNTGSPLPVTTVTNSNPLVIHRNRGQENITEVIPHYSILNWGPNIPQDQLLVAYAKRIYIYVYTPPKSFNVSGGNEQSEEKATATYWRFYKNDKMKGILSSMRKPDKIDIESGYYCFAAAGYCVANKNYYNFRPYSWYDNIYIAPAK